MASVPDLAICQHHKFGYCKFRELCRHRHINDMCEDSECEVQFCIRRHPKRCRFYDQYKRCKFGDFCSFVHDDSLVPCKKYEQQEIKLALSNVE